MGKQKYNSYEDRSEDKKYFTMIPNLILNHSTANDQALYLQMKRIVGDSKDVCYASEKYFQKQLGIGRYALKKSLKYLIDHKWIEHAGYRIMETSGGKQKIKAYLINDIWKENMEYYSKKKGVSRLALPNQGLFETAQRGVQNDIQGVSRLAPKNNLEEEQKRVFKLLKEGRKNLEEKGIITPKK